VPLVFWNGARIGIVTDSEYPTPAAGTPSPLGYDTNAKTIITISEADPNGANLTDFWDGFTLEFTPADRPKHG